MPARFLSALDRLEEAHADLTIRQLKYLLYVAEHPGITVAEAYRALGSNTSNASRTLALLTDVGNPRRPGLGLIEMHPDDKDRRLKRLTLTAKGIQFLVDLRKDLGL